MGHFWPPGGQGARGGPNPLSGGRPLQCSFWRCLKRRMGHFWPQGGALRPKVAHPPFKHLQNEHWSVYPPRTDFGPPCPPDRPEGWQGTGRQCRPVDSVDPGSGDRSTVSTGWQGTGRQGRPGQRGPGVDPGSRDRSTMSTRAAGNEGSACRYIPGRHAQKLRKS